MTTYTAGQLAAMSAAINAATQANQIGDYGSVMSALATYYSVQTSVRGYAQLALQVVQNTGSGIVANQEVENAVGSPNYTSKFKASLALQLAASDFSGISTSGQVPTLADVATDHLNVFQALGIPVTAWGGTAFTALGRDFTGGIATPAELSAITPPAFDQMSAVDVDASIENLFVAGMGSARRLDLGTDLSGWGTILGLQTLLRAKFPAYVDPLQFLQNQDGTYQVADSGQILTDLSYASPNSSATSVTAEFNSAGAETTSTTYLVAGGAIIDSYDSSNGLVAYEADYAPGGLIQTFYDTQRTNTWASLTNIYSDAGSTKISTTTVNHDGTSVKDTLNPTTGQVTQVDDYNAYGQETERDTYLSNGTIIDGFDTRTNTIGYEARYLPAGLTQIYYDTEDQYSWATITNQFQDAAAHVLESTDTASHDGTSTLRVYDYTNTQPWTSQLFYESSSGAVTSFVTNWNNGGSQDVVYNPAPGYTAAAYNFQGQDGTGALLNETLDLTGGTSQYWNYTGLAAGDQSQYWSFASPDGTGTLTGYGTYFSGGGQTWSLLDYLDDQPWSIANGTINAAGATTTVSWNLHNGDNSEWWYDTSNGRIDQQDYWAGNGTVWQRRQQRCAVASRGFVHAGRLADGAATATNSRNAPASINVSGCRTWHAHAARIIDHALVRAGAAA